MARSAHLCAVPRTVAQVTTRDAFNRFALTTKNALGQATSATYDDRNGSFTSKTDLNGLVTSITTDAFG